MDFSPLVFYLMDCEIAFVFAVGSSEDEAEEAVADAGKVVVVLHAVGRR